MNRLWAIGLWASLTAAAIGCKSTAGPDWLHPGPAKQQQARAVQYDPYPENEPGPKLEGTRPREYEKPMPEVDRSRQWSYGSTSRPGWLPWNWGR